MAAYIYNLGQLFSETVQNHIRRPAFHFPDGEVFTYEEIHQTSNQIAHYLTAQGVRKGQVIAIFNDKSITGFCLMLACLKNGIIYTNLDFTSPFERLRKILANCNPAFLFCGGNCDHLIEELSSKLPELPLIFYQTPSFQAALQDFPITVPENMSSIHGGDAAYIMFTSGSTGFPKGAVMSHSNLLHFIKWGQHTLGITPADVFTNVNPIYFDNSIFDFYLAIFSGACLVPVAQNPSKDPRQLVEIIDKQRCTIWFSVPSLLIYLLTTKAIGKENFSTIQTIVFGGEGFPKRKLKQLFELYGHRTQLLNVYGPTECTCICSSYPISETDFEQMQELAPLGNIAPNFGYEILAQAEAEADFGELALVGPSVGLGYFNDSERTTKAFVQNPKKNYREIMYKTGDLVHRDAKGQLHFKGRIDNQIKHLGYRIELEEIEAAINSLPYVNECGVIYEKINPELGQIIGFASVNTPEITPNLLLEALYTILPPYMLPKKVFLLDQLPKNQNGKVDRTQLMLLLSSDTIIKSKILV